MRLLVLAVTFLLLLLSLPNHASSVRSNSVDVRPSSLLKPTLTGDSPFTQLGITSESLSRASTEEFDQPIFWFNRSWQAPLPLQSQHTIRPYVQQGRLISTSTLSSSVNISYSSSLGICCSLHEPFGFSANTGAIKPDSTFFDQPVPFREPLSSSSSKLIASRAQLALLTNHGIPLHIERMHRHDTAAGNARNFNWHISSRLDQYYSKQASLRDNLQQTQYWTNEALVRWSSGEVELTIGIQFERFDHRQSFSENYCQSGSCETNSQTLRGSVQLAYELKQGLDTYIDISKGENAGLKFAEALSTAPLELLPSTNYRLGLSNAFMDNSLYIKTALYYSAADDKVDSFLADNFGNATRRTMRDTDSAYAWNDKLTNTQGFEVEGLYSMTDAIQFSMGVSYTQATYNADNANSQRSHQLSPLWQGSASLLVEDKLPGTKWQYLVNLNFTHVGQAQDDSSFNPTHTSSMMNVLSSQVGIRSPDSRYNLLVWSLNMNGENITINTTSTDLRNLQQSPRSSYGITFTAILGN
jgi:hypothetical protein